MKITIEKNSDLNYPNCKVINIYGDNYSGVTHHCRTGSRAIVQKNGKLLISHEKNIGQWMTPGGGTEGDETPVECCIREVAEETGYIVEPKECFLIFNEYYEDWKYISYYFECVVTGTTERKLTSREIKVGACPEWVDFGYIKDVFSHHQDYAESNEERRGIYLREYLVLEEFCIGDYMKIQEICDILRAELYNTGFEYGFFLNGQKFKPNMQNGFDNEYYQLSQTIYRVQNPETTLKEKIGTCIDAVVVMKYMLDKFGVPCKIWLLSNKNKNKKHTILTFEAENKVVYLELTPQFGKAWYGKELIYSSEQEFFGEQAKSGWDVDDVTNLIVVGEQPQFLLKRLK